MRWQGDVFCGGRGGFPGLCLDKPQQPGLWKGEQVRGWEQETDGGVSVFQPKAILQLKT